jgi:hypothetical protein
MIASLLAQTAALAPAAADDAGMSSVIATVSYLVAAALFILALKWLSAPSTARRGNLAGEIGMAAAIIGTLLSRHIVSYEWIIVGFTLGALIGAPMAIWMTMTAVPQRTALSHAFGGCAAALVGTAHYYLFFQPGTAAPTGLIMGILCIEVLLGSLTFTGSLMAFGKLQDILPTRPMVYKGQNVFNFVILGAAFVTGIVLTLHPAMTGLFPVLLCLSAAFRRAADPADRRGGYADGHRVAQQLRRFVGEHDGLRAGQQAPDHRGRPGRGERFGPLDHYVPGHEPQLLQRALRRVRPGAAKRRQRG